MNPLSKYQAPPGAYAFHCTDEENVDSIREDGILRSSGPDHDTSTIDAVLADLGYESPFPFGRTDVTYCHVDPEDVIPPGDEASTLARDRAVVVDVDCLSAPLYLADMAFISDLIDYRHVGPDIMISADTPERVIDLYRQSIVSVDSREDIVTYLERGYKWPELLVEGDIPPSAIVDVVG